MPLGVYFVVATIIYGGGEYLQAGLSDSHDFSTRSLLVSLISGLVFGGLMTLIVSRIRRRNGGRNNVIAINRSLKTGEVPAGVDTAQWISVLAYQRRQATWTRWASPVVFGLFTLLGVYLVVTDDKLLDWFFVVVFVAIGVYSTVFTARLIPRIDALEAKLRSPGRLSSETSGDLHP
ncbi:hypothetical protein BH09ACT1_BH09ACT1_20280 [soil metagenome]